MKRILLLVLGLGLISLQLTAQRSPEVVSVKTAVQAMEDGLRALENMSAVYVINSDGYRNSGMFYYRKPFYLRLDSHTDGSQIVSNGRLLWVHLRGHEIVAEQDLVKNDEEYQNLLVTQKSLGQLKQDYSFNFAEGGKDDPNFYILDLEPRISKIGFKAIRLWVNKQNGLVSRVYARTVNNKQVSVEFSEIKTDVKLDTGLFWFGMPDANVQVIRNTILPVDIFDKARR